MSGTEIIAIVNLAAEGVKTAWDVYSRARTEAQRQGVWTEEQSRQFDEAMQARMRAAHWQPSGR
jgi:hypothetical protein